MGRGPPLHRWDNDTRDTRTREPPSRVDSTWAQSANSTFAQPSRLEAQERQARRRRRSALALVGAGVGVAAVGASLVLLVRGTKARD